MASERERMADSIRNLANHLARMSNLYVAEVRKRRKLVKLAWKYRREARHG